MRRHAPNLRFAGLILLALIAAASPGLTRGEQGDAAKLVDEFKTSRTFWEQFEVAEKLVKLHDTSVLDQLRAYLKDDDRHVRGNAAFVFAALGHDCGLEVIGTILTDRSARPEGQGIPGGAWSAAAQIASDRYYAAHLFGDLKDPRAVPTLIPLLTDKEVNWTVPLGARGDWRQVRDSSPHEDAE